MPDWASFYSATGELSGQPTLGNIGSYSNISISVSDGTASASLSGFTISVNQMSNLSATLSWTAPTQNEDGSEPTMATEPTVTVRPEDTIPLTYADPLNTPLEVEVKAQDSNELVIELKRQ